MYPAAWAGAINVIVFEFTTVKLDIETPPNVTAVAPVKYNPCMVTEKPPAVVPTEGVTPKILGWLPTTGGGAGTAGCGTLPYSMVDPVAKSPEAPPIGGTPSINIELSSSVKIWFAGNPTLISGRGKRNAMFSV